MENQEIIRIIENLKGRKNYEEKKASKLGFKSRIEPSSYVIQISGNICQSFVSKNKRK